MGVNKFVFNGQVKFDLTGDTVTADKLLVGVTAHDKSGEQIEGACDFDVNSSDATATVAEILKDKTAYLRGQKVAGSMPNNGAVSLELDNTNPINIPLGFHDGSGTVSIKPTELAKLIGENIKQGISILGVLGTLDPTSGIRVQAKAVTPTASAQTVLPDSGYDYISQVTVNAIPYTETTNSAGGKTVTIG